MLFVGASHHRPACPSGRGGSGEEFDVHIFVHVCVPSCAYVHAYTQARAGLLVLDLDTGVYVWTSACQ